MQPTQQSTQLSLFEPKKTDEAPKDYSVEPIREEVPSNPEQVFFKDYEKDLAREIASTINYCSPKMVRVSMTETITPNRGADTYSHIFFASILTDETKTRGRYPNRGEVSSYTDPDMELVFGVIEAKFKEIFKAPVEIRASKIEKNGRPGVFKGTLDFILS